jgi:N-acetylglucosamine malate deacetylase 1
MKENSKTVLVLSPHSDDMEISCGGTVAKFIEEGHEVYSLVFSFAEQSIPKEFKRFETVLESAESAKLLGVNTKWTVCGNFLVRSFPSRRQEILDILIKSKMNIQPDIVLLPNSNDIHQDHQVIHQEGIRTFRNSTILGYENIWNSMGKSNMTTYIPLTQEHLNKKTNAIKCYKSQLAKSPNLIIDIIQLANIRGSEIGKDYCEVFETIRNII